MSKKINRLSISVYGDTAGQFQTKKEKLVKDLNLNQKELSDSFFLLLLLNNSNLDSIADKIKEILSS